MHIRRLHVGLGQLVVIAVVAAAVLARAPSPARADHCGPIMPDRASEIRGYTFVGILVSADDPQPNPNGQPPIWTFDVKKVYAFKDKPRTNPDGLVLSKGASIALQSSQCGALRRLELGSTYLFSTSTLRWPSLENSGVWRLHGNETTWVRMYRDLPARELFAANTLPEVLALVAPAAGLPPTATISAELNPDVPSVALLLPLFGVAVPIFLVTFGRRRARGDPPRLYR